MPYTLILESLYQLSIDIVDEIDEDEEEDGPPQTNRHPGRP